MNTTPFPIGFWNYASIDWLDVGCVKDWADAGMTLAMSPEYGPEPAHIAKMHEILDACSEAGISVILCDKRSYWRNLTAIGEEAYRAEFAAAVKDFAKHPAVFGFHVGDEPNKEDFTDACLAQRIQKELAPDLTPFCNLYPWHPGITERLGFDSWARYLDAYVLNAKPDLLCYDCYSQMNPGTEGWDMYFRNLREFGEAARRHNIPFWTTLLSVGHFRYRCPTEDDLRWQLNTALAHGAQGILYFFFYMRRPHDNYRVAPIDEHWERTQTFEWLSRVNRSLLKGPAAVVRELTLERVSHVGQAWGDVALFEGGDLVKNAVSHHRTPLIVSEFMHTNGSRYVMVVNNSQTDCSQAELTIGGKNPALFRVGWEASEARVAGGDGWKAQQSDDSVTVRPWLAPGQMELYRVASG
jgi:hypothetical protein